MNRKYISYIEILVPHCVQYLYQQRNKMFTAFGFLFVLKMLINTRNLFRFWGIQCNNFFDCIFGAKYQSHKTENRNKNIFPSYPIPFAKPIIPICDRFDGNLLRKSKNFELIFKMQLDSIIFTLSVIITIDR